MTQNSILVKNLINTQINIKLNINDIKRDVTKMKENKTITAKQLINLF